MRRLEGLSKLISKLLVVPVAVGTLAATLLAREPIKKIEKEPYWTWEYSKREDRNIKVQWGYSVSLNDHERRQYHGDREVLYRKIGQEQWLKEEGVWEAIFGEPAPGEGFQEITNNKPAQPCPLHWTIDSLKKISEEEIPIYVKGLYELWMDNDMGENSALATFAISKATVFENGTPFYDTIEPTRKELRYLEGQADKWVEKAQEYYK